MLMGEYSHIVDTKGRMILPAKFREELGTSFILTKGLDNCLFIYEASEWSVLEGKLKQLPLSKPEARAFMRFFFSGATQTECDKQGRILIPSNLREYAKLDKDVVVIGVLNRVEVWDKNSWNSYNDQLSPAVTEIAEHLADLGI
ncbi:division/cell wall cluster transcriptional repressor MraZ [Anaerosinus gibii]|uniref:Transcriptional regulator MraZ n=1 Tax=Selenobaculum gibii TaxID=3054208 RepID=A0A9Y2AIW5_9FIRM|nr:division/cell wall cluster transcriptional repressor MraZ [Selenobaculum gbiensis]WIW71664.1 division/cell wall cluster transcriptional repressor MraZ [Selenobaculum gbiensis]